nr:hypothetical protein CFP56_12892 [Quercus suber]
MMPPGSIICSQLIKRGIGTQTQIRLHELHPTIGCGMQGTCAGLCRASMSASRSAARSATQSATSPSRSDKNQILLHSGKSLCELLFRQENHGVSIISSSRVPGQHATHFNH